MEKKFLLSDGLFDSSIDELDDLLALLQKPVRDHCRRVAMCSAVIAEYAEKGFNIFELPVGTSLPIIVHLGGTCHDIGKVFAPYPNDYLYHPEIGAKILDKNKETFFDNEKYVKIVSEIILHHHEYFDGSGFPKGLYGLDIPSSAWICTIANDLDHRMWSEKTFQKNNCHILKEIKNQAGRKYSEYAVKCLEDSWSDVMVLYKNWMSGK